MTKHPACGKVRYGTMEEAERALARLIVRHAFVVLPRRAYSCKRCRGWHLTTKERRRFAKSA